MHSHKTLFARRGSVVTQRSKIRRKFELGARTAKSAQAAATRFAGIENPGEATRACVRAHLGRPAAAPRFWLRREDASVRATAAEAEQPWTHLHARVGRDIYCAALITPYTVQSCPHERAPGRWSPLLFITAHGQIDRSMDRRACLAVSMPFSQTGDQSGQ